ncbi:MAG: hypothetical protein PHX67_02655 [Candidatus Pacebacteria bacterium]|nr:hypothetical protein [Candidatus Paceibacterota bacterium]
MAKKKLLILILLGFIFLTGLVVFMKTNNQKSSSFTGGLVDSNNGSLDSKEKVVLFYAIGCPHCSKVDEYIKENNLEKIMAIEKKEVGFNRGNANEMIEKAKECGLNQNNLGVPFLWDGSKCLMGDVDIINFLEAKLIIK